ncbi:MAG: cupin domain-containing protein [Candidatus Methylomirabilia bacterium]
MPPRKSAKPENADHSFHAIYDRDVEWEDGLANELLTLPKGVKVKIFTVDPVTRRIDMKLRFPKGYVEPEHVHKSWHSILVTKGRMCVAGKDLRRGDYVFGWDLPHGPYEYPDSCEVFIVFIGGGTQHLWDEERHLRHRTRWTAKTAAGKKATARGEAARKRALERRRRQSPKPAKR